MARPLILSNGNLAVCMDRTASVDDLYYPHVGLYNHSNELVPRHKIGVYVDGAVHWLDDGAWSIKQDYYPGRLIGRTIANNPWLDIRIEFQDFVDYELNVFARNIHIINLADRPRDIKLFLHEAFLIGEAADNHDTVQYIPSGALKELNYPTICHYKGQYAFLITGNDATQPIHRSFDSYSTGRFGGTGTDYRDGVWCDAADGELAENPVERGLTDSIMQFNIKLRPHDSARVHYELAAGASISDAAHVLAKFKNEGLCVRLRRTDEYWREWIKPAAHVAATQVDSKYRYTFITSLLTIKAMTDDNGAILSSLDTEMLRHTNEAYVDIWPRDGAVAALTYAKLGYEREAVAYYNFISQSITDGGYLWQMYRPDGSMGPCSYPWLQNGQKVLPIQSDGSATVLYSFCSSALASLDSKGKITPWKKLYSTLAIPLANFLSDYIDSETKLPLPSYDIWGEHYETTTYTTALTYRALSLAADLADRMKDSEGSIKYRMTADEIADHAYILWNPRRNYFYRGFTRQNEIISYDERIDSSSLFGAWRFGLFDEDMLSKAWQPLASRFSLSVDKPRSPRYESDGYGGYENLWFVTSFWLGQYSNSRGDHNYLGAVLDWADRTIEETNALPEQTNAGGESVISTAPHTWSHADYILSCLNYGNRE